MIRDFDGVNGLSRAYDIGYDDGYHQGMIRAYDDYGNVVDLVEWEKNIRAKTIDECMKAIVNTESKVFNPCADKEWEVLTLLANRQSEILNILEQLKEQKE